MGKIENKIFNHESSKEMISVSVCLPVQLKLDLLKLEAD